jgi:hypothetical protein
VEEKRSFILSSEHRTQEENNMTRRSARHGREEEIEIGKEQTQQETMISMVEGQMN